LPDQVVGAQRGKHAGQFAALEQSALADGRLARLNGGFIDQAADLAGIGKIQQRREQGQRSHGILATQAGHRKRGAEDGAADAKAECIDFIDAADFLHHLDRLQRTLLDVVVPTQVALLGLDVLPRNQEYGITLLHRVAHHRVFRLQVKDVVLVDAGRHHQEGPRRDRLGLRRILQELHQLVFIDHRTGCHRQVAADLEGAVVGHRDATLFQVGDQVLDALLDAETLGLHRRLDEFGIGREEIRRRHRIDHLPRQEAHAVLGLAIGHRGRLDHAFYIVGIDQVSLAQVVIDRTFGPGRIVKSLVTRRRAGNLRRRLAGCLAQHALPELGVLRHPFLLQRFQRVGFGNPCRSGSTGYGLLLLIGEKLAEALRHGIAGLHHGLHRCILIGKRRHPLLLGRREILHCTIIHVKQRGRLRIDPCT
jgi:hypothetical protein